MENMDSLSFDRAASIYDATRSNPTGVLEQAAASLAARLPPGTHLLEIGVGTGRIALPLLDSGLQVTGVDLSRLMMEQLRAKLSPGQPGPALAEANALRLPFPSEWFEAVMAVHVLHLIVGWQEAAAEARRVMKPHGALVVGYDEWPKGSPSVLLREEWENIMRRAGWEPHPRMKDYSHLRQHLLETGAVLEEWSGAVWEQTIILADELERLAGRAWSATWEVPDPLFTTSIEQLRAWAPGVLGPLEAEHRLERRFVWQVYRWG